MIGLPYYGAFDIRLCQIPTIAPYMPEGGGGVVGQYIDRCISLFMASKVSTLVHLNHLYIDVLTPGTMSHMRSYWAWRLLD